jgi:hypothetical protein
MVNLWYFWKEKFHEMRRSSNPLWTCVNTECKGVELSADETIHNNIIIGLESSRGHCPVSMSVSIEDIINNAENFVS